MKRDRRLTSQRHDRTPVTTSAPSRRKMTSQGRHDTFLARRGYSVLAVVLSAFTFAHGPACADQKALLIGIGAYTVPGSALEAPPNDVRAMKRFLVEHWGFGPSDIKTLVDEQATKAGILDAIETWLPAHTQPGDRVIIYFSGHGDRITDDDGDEVDGMDETLVPVDYGRNGERDEDMLRDDELADALEEISGRHVLFIADSCFSGTVTRTLDLGGVDPNGEARPRLFPSRVSTLERSFSVVRDEEPLSRDLDVHLTLSAALPHQLAWEEDGKGVFTTHLIEALTDSRADMNGNGKLTSTELVSFIKPKTEAWCNGVSDCKKEGFTPNLDPRNESVILQPVSGDGWGAVAEFDDTGAVSDILPEDQDLKVTIRIDPGSEIVIGQDVSFSVRSSTGGYLTLLDLNAEGKLTLLFPVVDDIRSGKSGRIRARAPLTVPDPSYGFEFKASAPAGEGHVIAIVTEDRVDFDSLLEGHREFEPIDNAVEFISAVSAKLLKVWTGDDEKNRAARYSVGYAQYQIYE